MGEKHLSGKQKAFADCIISGAPPVTAYLEAGYSRMSEAAMAAEASKLIRHPKISQAIRIGREQVTQKVIDATAYSRAVAIERLELVNEKAYEQLRGDKFISRDAMNAFFQSLDRLEELTRKEKIDGFLG